MEVTCTDGASQLLGPYHTATLQTQFMIQAKTGGKMYVIQKNPSFCPKVSPKEKWGEGGARSGGSGG